MAAAAKLRNEVISQIEILKRVIYLGVILFGQVSVAAIMSKQSLSGISMSICRTAQVCFLLKTQGMSAGSLKKTYKFNEASLQLPFKIQSGEGNTLFVQNGIYDVDSELMILNDENFEYLVDLKNLKLQQFEKPKELVSARVREL